MRLVTNNRRHSLKHLQKGQAILIVLVLFLLLAMPIIMATLNLIATSYKTNTTYKELTVSTYAAEAGIQDAMWRVLNEPMSQMQQFLDSYTPAPTESYDVFNYNYPSGWSYNLPDPSDPNNPNDTSHTVNGYSVTPNINNTWVPMLDVNVPNWIPSTGNLTPPGKAHRPTHSGTGSR